VRESKVNTPMKNISILLLSLLALVVNASAQMRTFTSADGERTFQATLIGYNANTQVVTVRNEQNQNINFNIDLISEKDREFVKANPQAENVALEVRFDRLVDRQNANRSKNQRTTTYDAGYNIRLLNYTPQDLGKVEVEYLLIYRKDDVSGKAETHTVRGSGSVHLEANGSQELETTTVKLVNFFKRSTVRSGGGGCSRGGGCSKQQTTATRAQRSRDTLVGCIARVKLDGKVVSTSATAPNLLRQYENEFGGKY